MKKTVLIFAAALLPWAMALADIAPAPVITIELVGNHNVFTPGNYYQEICVFDYKVTATGEGDIHLYLNGIEVPNPCYIPQDYPDWHDDTWYENEVMYCFSAYVPNGGGPINKTDEQFVVSAIPRYSLNYEAETESYWMSFDYGTRYRNWNSSSEWLQFSQPFKVWQAPQNLYGGVHIEVMDDGFMDNGYLSSNMGILHDLSMHFAGNSIFRYGLYEEGVYHPYEMVYDITPETPIVPLYNYICNKYWMPSAHQPCYSGDVVIPDYVECILDYTFENCPDLTSVFIPASVTSINEHAFVGCTGLDRVEIESLDSWCEMVFIDSLSNPLLYADHLILNGEEVTDLVFESETNLFIDRYAFAGYKGLASVTCYSSVPIYASEDAFYKLYDRVKLYVPYESLEAYRDHEEWGRFTRIVPFIGAGPGDMDGDGQLNIGDVTALIDMFLNGEQLPAYCDLDGDGSVNINDLTELIDLLSNGE